VQALLEGERCKRDVCGKKKNRRVETAETDI
jgi:hypothetical protein